MKAKTRTIRQLFITFLSVILVFTTISPSLAMTTYHSVNDDMQMEIEFSPNEGVNLDELPDNTIVAYVEEIPIRVEDINKDGTIRSDKVTLIEENYINSLKTLVSTRATFADNCKMTVATKHRNKLIIVLATMTARDFSQNETHTYLPNSDITGFADALEEGTRQGFIGFLTSYIPVVGNILSAINYFTNSIKYNNIDKLRNIRNAGNAASYSIYNSRYGNTVSVATWDKKTIKGRNYSSTDASQSKYTVKEIIYEK